uniref:Uncharacterized protein n=1 Tax=Aegilops tauschii subsp. strangulata TaxID=200361 RepID=A0A453RS49_AEGTS
MDIVVYSNIIIRLCSVDGGSPTTVRSYRACRSGEVRRTGSTWRKIGRKKSSMWHCQLDLTIKQGKLWQHFC